LGSYELIYEPNQKPNLSEGFLPFDSSDVNRPELREITGFRKFAETGIWKDHELSGLFSPKFLQKSGITADSFRDFISSNPGYDVYLFHPFPKELSIANHFLELAEYEHPGIESILSKVWISLFGTELPKILLPDEGDICCHCNYFVASQLFWEGYSEFISGFCHLLESDVGKELLGFTPYTLSKGDDIELPIAAFVFERCLSHYLKMRENKLTILNFSVVAEDWVPPELFDGEHEFLYSLLKGVQLQESFGKEHAKKARELAVVSYYAFRKLKFVR